MHVLLCQEHAPGQNGKFFPRTGNSRVWQAPDYLLYAGFDYPIRDGPDGSLRHLNLAIRYLDLMHWKTAQAVDSFLFHYGFFRVKERRIIRFLV